MSKKSEVFEVFLAYTLSDRLLRSRIGECLSDFELTPTEWLLLEMVCRSGKSGLTMGQIAERMGVSLPQVTALIKTATKDNLIKQDVPEYDKRSRVLKCTKKGVNMIEKINQVLEACPEKSKASGYDTKTATEGFKRILKLISE
jgi:MarR family transcriptional regulator, transcriptional regulator for hemolysin